MRYWLLWILLCAPWVHSETYQFGIVPQQSAAKLAALWSPILNHLSKQTGHTYEFATAPDIPTFEQRLLAGDYDFAYMNPYHLTVFAQKPGYIAFARQADLKLQGIMVVPKDSPITRLEQLDGQKVAFPSPAAFAASVIPRAYLASQGISIEPVYVSSHDSVYLTVAKGIFVAGGGVKRTLANTNEATRDQLKILWQTDGYTPHAFASLPSVPSEHRQALQLAMTNMHLDPQGIELLETIKFRGIVQAKDSDWDDIRSLGITLLDHMLD